MAVRSINRQDLVDFYEKHDKKRLKLVDEYIRQYSGEDLLRLLEQKYGKTSTSALRQRFEVHIEISVELR